MAREVRRRDLLAPRRRAIEPRVRQPPAGVRGDLDLDDGVDQSLRRRLRHRLVVHVDRPRALVTLVHRDADALALRPHPLQRVVQARPPLGPALCRRRELRYLPCPV